MYKIIYLISLLSPIYCASFLPHDNDRIIGGKDATIEDFPYQLSLRFLDDHFCGASIISENFAITAAHCTHDNLARFLTIHAGTTISSSSEGQTVKVKKYINHPNFNKATMDYDVAILFLEEPLKFGVGVQRIALPRTGEDVEVGSSATISGWGKLAEGGSSSKTLKQVDVHIMSQDDCQMIYGNIISDAMICTFDNGKDACQGDSGGPLVANGKQIGIVLWGIGCARPDKAGVFTKISAIRDFIFEHTQI